MGAAGSTKGGRCSAQPCSIRVIARDCASSGEPNCLPTVFWLRSSAVLVLAKLLERHSPGFGFLAAFAEAATIGGLADWYAVVVLFRRPLRLPLPHTAIIPANHRQIAERTRGTRRDALPCARNHRREATANRLAGAGSGMAARPAKQ